MQGTDLKFGRVFNLLLCLAALASGCTAGRGVEEGSNPFPPQIGEPRPSDSTEIDTYEHTVVRIIHHIEDGVRALASVQDAGTSKQAAGMFIEASGRVVDLRQKMLEQNPRDIIPTRILIAYGPRYFFARLETEQQLRRIKTLGPDVHGPLRSVLTRLDDDVKRIEKEYDQAKNRRP